jgi:hypothetical protein
MTLARYRPQGQLQQKIRPEHLDRAAVVYVRQSSRQQVLDHSESTRLQYGLAERAVALGWARSQVVVIDDDLGVSAATADSRKGFSRLVTEVTMGRAGMPIGYVRRPSGEAALDPDEQAQHVVRLVFGAFRRLGTLNGVLRYLVGQGVQLPVRVHSGPAKGELEWRRPRAAGR